MVFFYAWLVATKSLQKNGHERNLVRTPTRGALSAVQHCTCLDPSRGPLPPGDQSKRGYCAAPTPAAVGSAPRPPCVWIAVNPDMLGSDMDPSCERMKFWLVILLCTCSYFVHAFAGNRCMPPKKRAKGENGQHATSNGGAAPVPETFCSCLRFFTAPLSQLCGQGKCAFCGLTGASAYPPVEDMALSLDNNKTYHIIAHPAQEPLAKRLVESNPAKFQFHETSWGKFKDGTDNIEVGGIENLHAFAMPHRYFFLRPSLLEDFHLLHTFLHNASRQILNYARARAGFYPVNHVRGNHVLFLASFHNNDATLSQFHVLNMLCESFVESMVRAPPASREWPTPRPCCLLCAVRWCAPKSRLLLPIRHVRLALKPLRQTVLLPYWPVGTTPIPYPRDPIISLPARQALSAEKSCGKIHLYTTNFLCVWCCSPPPLYPSLPCSLRPHSLFPLPSFFPPNPAHPLCSGRPHPHHHSSKRRRLSCRITLQARFSRLRPG